MTPVTGRDSTLPVGYGRDFHLHQQQRSIYRKAIVLFPRQLSCAPQHEITLLRMLVARIQALSRRQTRSRGRKAIYGHRQRCPSASRGLRSLGLEHHSSPPWRGAQCRAAVTRLRPHLGLIAPTPTRRGYPAIEDGAHRETKGV